MRKGKTVSTFFNAEQVKFLCEKFDCEESELQKIIKDTSLENIKSEYFRENFSIKREDLESNEITKLNKQLDFLKLPREKQIQLDVKSMSFDEIKKEMGINPKGKDNTLNKIREKGRHGGQNLAFDMTEHLRAFPENPFAKISELFFFIETHYRRELVTQRYLELREQLDNENKIERLAEDFDQAVYEMEKEEEELEYQFQRIEFMFKLNKKGKYVTKKSGTFEYTKEEIKEKIKEYDKDHKKLQRAIRSGLLG